MKGFNRQASWRNPATLNSKAQKSLSSNKIALDVPSDMLFMVHIKTKEIEMTLHYEFGKVVKFPANITQGIVTQNTKNAYVGFRAFVRNEKSGKYIEVLALTQEEQWVDGTNEGFWFASTHDTKADAVAYANRAYKAAQKL